MSQESTKEPVVALVGRFLCRGSLYEKGETKTDASKLAPLIVFPFFSLLRKPAERSSADCRFVDLCVCDAVFTAAKTSGMGNASCGWRARFAAAKTAFPEGATTQVVGRPGRLRRPERAKRAEKESGDHRGELARSRGLCSLFRIACPNKPTKDWFSRERNPPLPFGR